MRTYTLLIRGTNSIAQVTAKNLEDAKAIAAEHTGYPRSRFTTNKAAE